jgi:hypothetical protein
MDFFELHSWYILIFLVFFPRLTLLIGSFTLGGLFWWLGWIFCPRFLIAILALPFLSTNPILVILAWISAFGLIIPSISFTLATIKFIGLILISTFNVSENY